MTNARKRTIKTHHARLSQRGLARFEVMAPDGDRDLIRSLAHELAEDGPRAEQLRVVVKTAIDGEAPKPGGILAALRRSPLVGVDLDLHRPREDGRPTDL